MEYLSKMRSFYRALCYSDDVSQYAYSSFTIEILQMVKEARVDIYPLSQERVIDEKITNAIQKVEACIEKPTVETYALLIFLEDGSSGKMPPNLKRVHQLYQKMYDLTKDELILQNVLNQWKIYEKELKKAYLEEAFDARMLQLSRDNLQNVPLVSHDEAYYDELYEEYIKKDESSKDL